MICNAERDEGIFVPKSTPVVDEPYLQNFLQNLRGWLRSHAGREFWVPVN